MNRPERPAGVLACFRTPPNRPSSSPTLRGRTTRTDVSLRDMWALEKAARCLDCNSRTHLTEPTPGVYLLEVRHDDTCPTYRGMQGDRHA